MSLQRNSRLVVLEGWVNPSQIMGSHRIRFFSAVHILLLTWNTHVQTARLESRNLRSREKGVPESKIQVALDATQIMQEGSGGIRQRDGAGHNTLVAGADGRRCRTVDTREDLEQANLVEPQK